MRSILGNINKLRLKRTFTTVESGAFWCTVNGFSRFASRNDLWLSIGDINLTRIDPILDYNLFPTGRWAIELSRNDDLKLLKENLKGRAASITAFQLYENEIKQVNVASKFGISQRTVRLRNVPLDIGSDALKFAFKDFRILEWKNNTIKGFGSRRISTDIFLEFETPEEAERAVQEKLLSEVRDIKLQMIWYNC